MQPFNYPLPFANMPARRVRLTKTFDTPVFERNKKGEFVMDAEGCRVQIGTMKDFKVLDIRVPKPERVATPIPQSKFAWFRSRPYMWDQRGVTGITSAHIYFGMRTRQHVIRQRREQAFAVCRSHGVFNPTPGQIEAAMEVHQLKRRAA